MCLSPLRSPAHVAAGLSSFRTKLLRAGTPILQPACPGRIQASPSGARLQDDAPQWAGRCLTSSPQEGRAAPGADSPGKYAPDGASVSLRLTPSHSVSLTPSHSPHVEPAQLRAARPALRPLGRLLTLGSSAATRPGTQPPTPPTPAPSPHSTFQVCGMRMEGGWTRAGRLHTENGSLGL